MLEDTKKESKVFNEQNPLPYTLSQRRSAEFQSLHLVMHQAPQQKPEKPAPD